METVRQRETDTKFLMDLLNFESMQREEAGRQQDTLNQMMDNYKSDPKVISKLPALDTMQSAAEMENEIKAFQDDLERKM